MTKQKLTDREKEIIELEKLHIEQYHTWNKNCFNKEVYLLIAIVLGLIGFVYSSLNFNFQGTTFCCISIILGVLLFLAKAVIALVIFGFCIWFYRHIKKANDEANDKVNDMIKQLKSYIDPKNNK